jgi:hypothetical protein
MGATDELVDLVCDLRWADLDVATRHAAVPHLTDTLGVMVAGAATDTVVAAATPIDAWALPPGWW